MKRSLRTDDSLYGPDPESQGPIPMAAKRFAIQIERRSSIRFPIRLPAELCLRQRRIVGTTVNISSGGILVACSDRELKKGRRVRVRLPDWPSPRTLVIYGSVVREGPGVVAVRKSRYSFIET